MFGKGKGLDTVVTGRGRRMRDWRRLSGKHNGDVRYHFSTFAPSAAWSESNRSEQHHTQMLQHRAVMPRPQLTRCFR